MTTSLETTRFSHVAGRLSLDFANTVGSRHAEQANDRLVDWEALIAWGREAGLLPEASPWAADATVFARAIALREAVYRVFSAAADGAPAEAKDLETLNAVLGEAQPQVVRREGGYQWDWAPPPRPEHILWAVARDAADLLTGPLVSRVGECAGDSCGWLFLDTSKNASRRWCDMKDCGNRAKVRRHYDRRRHG